MKLQDNLKLARVIGDDNMFTDDTWNTINPDNFSEETHVLLDAPHIIGYQRVIEKIPFKPTLIGRFNVQYLKEILFQLERFEEEWVDLYYHLTPETQDNLLILENEDLRCFLAPRNDEKDEEQ